MSQQAQHLLVEFNQCAIDILNDPSQLENLMQQAAIAANATIKNSVFQQFEPQGVTGILLLAESHLSIHTWPQYAYASVDFYTCGQGQPEIACAVLQKGLQAQQCEKIMIKRGLQQPAMRIVYHH